MYRKCLPMVVAVCLAGCGGGEEGPEMAAVSGVVTLDGEPLADADVFFVANGIEGYGRTKVDGGYSLVRGAPIGDCKVYITKLPEVDVRNLDNIDPVILLDPEQMKAMHQGAAGKAAKPLLPPEYSDPKTTKLSISVPDGGTTSADFKL